MSISVSFCINVPMDRHSDPNGDGSLRSKCTSDDGDTFPFVGWIDSISIFSRTQFLCFLLCWWVDEGLPSLECVKCAQILAFPLAFSVERHGGMKWGRDMNLFCALDKDILSSDSHLVSSYLRDRVCRAFPFPHAAPFLVGLWIGHRLHCQKENL